MNLIFSLLLGCALCCGGWAGCAAATLEVSPVVHELPAGRSALAMAVGNGGTAGVTVQVRAFVWSQPGGEDTLLAAPDVVVSPPLFSLAAGARQIVRVLLPEPPAPSVGARSGSATEGSWRLLIDEIPSQGEAGAEPIRFALRLSVPIFRASADAAPAALRWWLDAGQNTLVLQNDGARRARLRQPALQGPDGRSLPVPGADMAYVLGGAQRRWALPPHATVAADAAWRLTAQTDAGRIEVPLDKPVHAAR